MSNNQETAEFSELRQALQAWGSLNDRQQVWTEIEEVVEALTQKLGDAVRIHIPSSNSYVAVTFKNEAKRVGAYINVGFVDQIIQTEKSHNVDTPEGYWRTPLSTVQSGGVRSGETEAATELCPSCFISVPSYGECGCGWSPRG
jgi:hypothetical protein